jgi:hypothetical protein
MARRPSMARRVIPIRENLPQAGKSETARDFKSILLAFTLALLHLASIALALTYF